MAHAPRPTPAPNRHTLFHKRQSYVTVSVIANDTDTSTSTDASSHSPFPVAIAIPALVGGMAAAIAAFGFWLWWSKRSKRLKRERWEAAQRRKHKRLAAEKDKQAHPPSAGQSQQKSPTGEKARNPILPPLSTAQPYYPPSQTNEYGYAPSQQGYSSWQTQPGIEQVQYGRQASHPQQGYYNPPTYAQGSAPQLSREYSSESTIPLTQNITPPAASPTLPTNNHNSNNSGNGSKSNGNVPPPRSSDEEKSSTSSSSSPSKKSSKNSRAIARMAVAESAAANASVDRMFRHKPSKPSPLAIKAQQERDAQNAKGGGDPLTRISSDETANPFNTESEGLYPAADDSRAVNATSGEWGVALGSPDEEDTFADSQAAVLDGSDRREKSNYSEDPYLRKKTQTTSGLYSQDPYALYHEEEEEDEEDADRYHNAAESMGLGTASKNKKRYVNKWV
ncbi:hypothetical protein I314_02235 [Cryptococcus bacillisporus CA1873]|uniref:Uncharacterized protein n=1 Tax=Cryptococcus bacillisporus CA1873 TaxID=1296111 RepID=A0ABR5BFB1_CRYGA|nr:hypothetical protein I314_02235 [Cryptococcus bacillisporus CA1873]|eukprot:KIR67818.1 hypothetical protein I314_02235 [Cryptococcus gattii CA1873]